MTREMLDKVVHDEKQNKKMIDKWLKKNKPSKQFKDEEPMGHVTPEGTLGSKTDFGGFKL